MMTVRSLFARLAPSASSARFGNGAYVARMAACALLAGSLMAAPAAAQDVDGISVGSVAPAFVASDLGGHRVRLTPTAGRPMLIEFWATWCEFCERLEPTMKASYAKYGSTVQFAAVAVNVNQSPSRVARHVAERSLAYPVYYDVTGNATRAYDVQATSFVVIIDKQGRVAYTGMGDKQNLDAALRRVQ